uniref:Nonsense-mediated mRNA decay factor SMG8 n=1 Tax=Bursaphelenchus xylophilus TaxID=6326 RepID=A0A1I7RMD7_BURXY
MREAQEFTEWLAAAAQPHWTHRGQLEQPVLVVGVVAKSSKTGDHGGKLIDQLVENAVFCGSFDKHVGGSIEVFYSPYHQIIFLYVNSYHDGHLQPSLFTEDKSFFDVLKDVESLFIKYLFVIFLLSHVVTFIQPDTRLDSTLIRHLLAVNEMRAQTRPTYARRLANASGLPGVWSDEGRLALPRILFIMHENRVKRGSVLRPGQNFHDYDLTVERLERSREYQLVHLLKSQSLTAEHLGIALASLSPHRIPFVHVVDPANTETNVIEECLLNLCKGTIKSSNFGRLIDDNLRPVTKAEARVNASEFLLGHVKDILKRESKQSFFFLIPTLEKFIQGSSVLMEALEDFSIVKNDKLARWLCEESHFENDLTSQYFRAATDLYRTLLNNGKPISKITQNVEISGARHLKAIKYIGAFLRLTMNSTQLDALWPVILKKCQVVFKGSTNVCDALSVTNTRCRLLAHKERSPYMSGKSMDECLKGRCFNHFSGYSHLSTCSCGQSQKLRNDPFDAKEANYDFYTQFGCCKKLENMPFKLYNPGIKWDVTTTETMVVRKGEPPKPRGVKLLSRKREEPQENGFKSQKSDSYVISRPKSQSRMVNELTWQYNKMCHEHSTNYLHHMWFTKVPNGDIGSENPKIEEKVKNGAQKVEKKKGDAKEGKELLPLYPSWSVVCLGPAKIYIHANGIKDQPNFIKGSDFLLPWDLNLTVKSERWLQGMKEILKVDRLPWREKRLDEDPAKGTHREKVKLFIGFEYECPQGHRFFCDKPQHILAHDRNDGLLKTDAEELVKSNLPLYARCKCSKTVVVNAQLMRIHLVTPKAPVGVRLVPMVMVSGIFGYLKGIWRVLKSREMYQKNR